MTDQIGHLAYQDGKPRPGLCHCAAGEAHDIEPAAPAEAYGWAAIPPECPVTGWPQIDNPACDMCSCGHRHIRITAWGGGSGG
jgi:hypothetical protein